MFQLHFENQIFRTPEDFRSSSDNEVLQQALSFCRDWMEGIETFIQKTSGSTGVPKEIEITRKQMIASAQATGDFFQIKSSDLLLACLHPNYIAGKMMLVRAIIWDAPLILVEPSSDPLQRIPNTIHPDFVAMVPLQVENSLKNQDSKRKLQQIKHILIGGAPCSAQLQKQLAENEIQAWQSFGMTETVSHIALAKITGAPLWYHPLPGVKIGQDERETLWIESPMSRNQRIQTNDRITFNSSGNFQWLGRVDFVVNSGGIKLFPEVLEQQIEVEMDNFFPGKRYFLGGIPDPTLGEKLVLLIESSEKDRQKAEILLRQLTSKISRYERPREVVFLTHFEETSSGKINRIKTLAHASLDH
ncbi:acyl-CoA synthetase [Algoriphagus kandeliae]|uniref:Acyl-CoA synthetase n=1 Tax=Algoriphagus kandeliae TaxID=2562278 RepID=A0A4Y9QTI0_9BACT|nr:AMP-binding protein [Algoriphagus kandeliae]TFV94245.1 acyl-CoA synthetase [Algoriphagus kandeliae]